MDLSELSALGALEKKHIALAAAEGLSPEDQQAIVRALGDPSQKTTDNIWMIVVIGFVVVLVGAFAAMAWYYANKDINLDKMLTVITTVSAFLAGLLAPSPVKK
ncbi:MAG TPA: hypothetical protein VFC23_11565 [Thermoanaerobaculia bacterium]|nr:hypothetical protein [Thermoanaerobaculia bacterium]